MADNELQALSNKSSELAADLDRNWLLQIITAGVALLYLTDQAKAGELAANVHVDPDLVEVAIPLVFTYLFIRMGYLLGLYLETRANLIARLPGDEEPRKLFLLIHNDVSVFALLSELAIGDGYSSSTESGRPKILSALRLLPYGLLLLFVGAVLAVNTGLGLYFGYDVLQEEGSTLRWLVPGVAITALFFFYLQFLLFVFAKGLRFKGHLIWLVTAIAIFILSVSLMLAGWMIISDPIEPDKGTKPPSTCVQGYEMLDAWETVLIVPDDLSSMEPERARQVLRSIENAYPEGCAHWQFELQILDSA